MAAHRLKVQVWVIAAKGPDTQVLLLRTLPARGAFWQPVTGSVEPEEFLDTAAARELLEETGLALRPRPLSKSFEYEKNGARFEEHGFVAHVDAPSAIRLDHHEHDAFRWVSPDEGAQALIHPSNTEMLEAALKEYR